MQKVIGCNGRNKTGKFKESRRLQLAAEQSRVTGFIIRHQPGLINTIACVSRWRISTLPSEPGEGLPGVGFPKWQVELLKVRNGRPANGTLNGHITGYRGQSNRFFLLHSTKDNKQDDMGKRFVAIWFRHLKTDTMIRRQQALKEVPFVLAFPDHGRMLVTEPAALAKAKGIYAGMVVADARIILPVLQVLMINKVMQNNC